MSVGQDLSVGYSGRDQEKAYFYVTESFTFRVLEQRAAVYLKPKRSRK